MIRQLSGELDQQHRLVNGQGSQRLGPGGQRLSHYRFRHILFQRYLYHNLAEAERVYLHEAMGNELEQVYGEQTEAVAVEVARQEAKSLELRAVMSLSRLWQRQGKQEEAYQMLAEIYDWFTEGFDTADLREARALFEA